MGQAVCDCTATNLLMSAYRCGGPCSVVGSGISMNRRSKEGWIQSGHIDACWLVQNRPSRNERHFIRPAKGKILHFLVLEDRHRHLGGKFGCAGHGEGERVSAQG